VLKATQLAVPKTTQPTVPTRRVPVVPMMTVPAVPLRTVTIPALVPRMRRPAAGGPPTDAMSKLSVSEHPDPGQSTPHLSALNEDDEMDIDEENEGQPSVGKESKKRKRDEEYEMNNNNEEEEEEEEEEERKPQIKQEGEGRRPVAMPSGELHSPPCAQCTAAGQACQVQKDAVWACVRCSRQKLGCQQGGKEGKRRNAAPRAKKSWVIVEDSDEEIKEILAPKLPAPKKKSAPKRTAPKRLPTTKPAAKPSAPETSAPSQHPTGKGKQKGTYVLILSACPY